MKLEFSLQTFEKKAHIPNFFKIWPVAAELFHANWRMKERTGGHDEANSRSSQLCERA
jgi:hypothetical protein